MIYDCFTYLNEDLLLELRLNYLNNVVDKFIIIEANKTHAGNDKKQNFDINKFKKFADKIIYVFYEDFPETDMSWIRENIQRNYIHDVLIKEGAKDDDIIIVSDLDEIPSVEAILEYKTRPQGIAFFNMKFYNYYMNLLKESEEDWIKAKIFQYKDFYRPVEFDWIDQHNMCCPININQSNTATRIRLKCFERKLLSGGWHFSWIGNSQNIKYKLENYAHQEFNNETSNNIKHIEQCLKNQTNIIDDKDCKYKRVDIDKTFPKYMLDNLDKFKDYIL